MPTTRVTVTLSSEIVRAIDREEPNRSRSVPKTVSSELDRRRSEQLKKSLLNPHPETLEIAEVGFAAWAESISDGAAELVAPETGEPLRWSAEHGWRGGKE